MPPDDERIRRASFADAERLLALMRECSAYRGPWAPILEGYAFTAEQFNRDLVFLAETGPRVLGFYSLAHPGSAPELDLMFVADACQGEGLGARLFDHMRVQARERGIGRVTIVSHPPAEGFYLRMGARRVGTKPPAGRVSWERPVLVLDV